MNNIVHKATKVLFTGASGSGKTNAFIKFIYASDYDYYFVYDHQGEICERLNAKGCDLESFTTFAQMDDFLFGEKESEEIDTIPFIIFDPSENFAGIYEETFESFCSYVFDTSSQLGGKKLFACDELQMLTSNMSIDRPLQAILQTGRRKGIDCAFCSQQPNELHNKIRNQITHLFAFRTLDPLCLKWIASVQLPDIERLISLPDGEAIFYETKISKEDKLKLDLST